MDSSKKGIHPTMGYANQQQQQQQQQEWDTLPGFCFLDLFSPSLLQQPQ